MAIEAVKQNLAQLTKKDSKTIDALFSGKKAVLKKNVDSRTAEKFKTVFEKTGAACELETVEAEAELSNLTLESNSSRQEEKEKSHEPMNTCPNCGFEQVFNSECQQCGIVFSKFFQNNKMEEPAAEGPPPLSEEMQEAVAQAKMIGTMSVMQNRKRHTLLRIFKLVRIGLLTSVLIVVALYTTCTHSRISGWEETLDVVIYPINGDQSEKTEAYINTLDSNNFTSIETFMADEASSYNIQLKKPVTVHLAPAIMALPPEPPGNQFPLTAIWWSLKMRYWALRHNTSADASDIRIYVIYKSIKNDLPQLEVSLGLRKGYIGMVNTSPEETYGPYTNIVITHELLHTLGASDKYNYATLAPVHPDGYAAPDKEPLYPQSHGEIMAVRIPSSPSTFSMPNNLNDLIIGEKTCMEIQWCNKEEN